MIHTGYDPFGDDVAAFSYNIGDIKKYELLIDHGLHLKIHTEQSVFSGAPTPSFARRYSCFEILFQDENKNEISSEDLELINKALEQTKCQWDTELGDFVPRDECGKFYIVDPRVVRAYILAYYEYYKDISNFPEKRINTLLNSSVDWTIDEAKEWLTRNGFKVEEYWITEFRCSQEEESYFLDPRSLIDPYWIPENKRKCSVQKRNNKKIYIAIEPFHKRVCAFSNYMGIIKSYEYHDFSLKVKTEQSTFFLYCRPSFTRSFSAILCWYEKEGISPSELKQIKKAVKKTNVKWDYQKREWIPYKYCNSSFYIIDPRPVRAYILGNYMHFRYCRAQKKKSKEVREADDKRITALLNESVDWTIDEAKEWLTQNGFLSHDHLSGIDYSLEDDPYISYVYKLIDPSWTPKNKRNQRSL